MTISLQLPDEIAARARSAGLFEPERVARLFAEKLAEEDDPRTFFELARDLQSAPGEPLTLDEIQAEVDSVRADRAAREAGR